MVIIDGHNRQSLCEKHGIPYKMAVFSFEDLLEAKRWAVENQRGRRNLEKWELGKIALKLKPDIEAKAKANQSAGGGDQKSEDVKSGFVNSQNPISPVNTTQELADAVGIGHQTMSRVMQINEHAPSAVKEALDNGELSVKGGKSFICCSATVKDKKTGELRSRIRPTLIEGSIATCTRTNPHYIVTEYGKVNLKGLSVWERAEALISIAAPQFQEELVHAAEKQGIWRACNRHM